MAQGNDASSLLKEFYALQEERVKVYQDLDKGHADYLQTAPNYNFVAYRQVVHNCTEEFNRISNRIIEIEKVFKDELGKSNLAGFIRNVQDGEKEKLELTADLQLAKQKVIDEPSSEEHPAELADIKQRMSTVVDKITSYLDDLKYEAEDLLSEASDR
ncbi:required for excision 1-B domain-containing protein-like [Amphiura filiformis]|uniref:required for excision 1-B domain-containing protein-like n=1 Tax=Amphiura filiformis TaxID=82378 RepID=UPI003B20D6AE